MKISNVLACTAFALFATTLAFAQTAKLTVQVENPKDGTTVSEITAVSGTVSDPQADVFLVVHPTATGDYWVQQSPTIGDDGKWGTSVHIGQGSQGVGEVFEIRAFVGPNQNLTRGQVLTDWPSAKARSNVVRVTRQ
jgi:hypothetical protein